MKPIFTALIPNYNDSAHIGVAIDCVKAQTVPFDEVLIIDDASTDNSVAIIEALIKDLPQARLVRNEQNMGVVATLNKGFGLARGDYVQMISANDVYFDRIVEHAARMVEKYPGVAMISGNAACYDAIEQKQVADIVMRLPQEEAFISAKEFLEKNREAPVSMNGGANMINRNVYLALGGQDIALKWYADWFLYLLIGLTHGFAYVPYNFVTCRLEGAKSFSSGMYQWDRQRPTLERLVELLHTRYPKQGEWFREIALFPRYNFKILKLIMKKPCRWFLTPLFIWRCLGHQAAFWLKLFLPRQFLMALRARFRL